MAIAETAKLAVELSLKDNLTASLRTAQGQIAKFGADVRTQTTNIGSALGGLSSTIKSKLGIGNLGFKDEFILGLGRMRDAVGNFGDTLRTKLGNAADTVRRKFSGLFSDIKKGIGIGIGFGLTNIVAGATSSIIHFFTEAGDKAQEFGRAATDMAVALNLPIEQTTALIDALDDFGISADAQIRAFAMLEKNAEHLAGTTKAAAKWQEEFGFSLTDNNGKIVDATELLKRSADFFTSNATASQKAAAMQKLYGRSWQELIPVLALGRKGLEDELNASLHLSKQQIQDLQDLRKAQRDLGDAMDKLQIAIGTALAPVLTRAATAIKDFVSANREGISTFVQGIAKFGGEVADTIAQLAPLGRTIADAWNAIPADFRKLIIGGVVANKALKMTIGVDVIDALRKTLFNAVLGIKAGVVNVQGGVVNAGGAGGAAGGGGILGKVGTGLAVAGAALSVFGAFETYFAQNQASTDQSLAIQKTQTDWLKKQPSRQDLVNGLAGIDRGIADITSNPLAVLVQGDALNNLRAMRDAQLAALAKLDAINYSIQNEQNMVTIIQHTKSERDEAPSILNPKKSKVVPYAGKAGGLGPKGLAGGGPVDAGSLYLVGENGPEFFSSPSSGRVTSKMRVGVNVNVSTSARQNEQGRTIQFRYGPVPATAGAS